MIRKNAVVLYKNSPAIVRDIEQDKYIIQFCSFALTKENIAKFGSKGFTAQEQKVREKDITVISKSETPSSYSLEKIIKYENAKIEDGIKEAWELLQSDESTAGKAISFFELIDLIDSEYTDEKSWYIYSLLNSGEEFAFAPGAAGAGTSGAASSGSTPETAPCFIPRSESEIEELKKKKFAKENEAQIRADFIARLKQKKLLPEDSIFMGDVEAFALGKTDKSKTLSEAGFSQDVEKAHKLLIDTGIWDYTRNPFPARWGLSVQSAKEGLKTPPDEERVKVPGTAYAIDNKWSADPDDAIAFDGTYLWVHIADPASTVMPDSSIDKAARDRGATLYIPEGASRMLAEESLSDYALGLKKESRALSFRLLLEDNCAIKECKVFKTWVDVECITYEEADLRKDSPELKPLFDVARRNVARRNGQGAVNIDLPEVHITVEPETKKVSIVPVTDFESSAVVREMMLLAGEGAAHFAFENGIPFPYVSQEAPDIPKDLPEGLAGEFKKLKGMHKRSVGVTPSVHSGLGIGMYSQVTSPLRRYSDLIAHQQLRAFLDGRDLIDKNTMLERISAGDEAAIACKKAERKSSMHWTLVYLLQNPDWTGEAIYVDQKGSQGLFMIPSLAQQTLLIPSKQLSLNDKITVKASKIDIPTQNVIFVEV
ncbi:ribonuclease catalytic domain-containing protein [Treponema sp.]|uniref:ribonuclease catalytic domain-containing protein n=1 Tax=Treponema sp. TaxID=166 RepID=UPI00298E0EF4|nr:RNB domain-containing ribonuclease [Treponema sp.]MCR5613823.1 RNB domain-containing ribonuclease [Treponema sp.]